MAVDAVDVAYSIAGQSLTVEVQQDDGNDFSDSVTFPTASTTSRGVIRTATNAQVSAGTATNVAMTPSNLLTLSGTLISDADINVTSPSSESTLSGASRQAIAEAIAANSGGGGGGTDDQTAAEVTVDTTNFTRNLTSADDSVQEALETIDGFTQYQGAWQQASWPAGVIVTRSGIAYISLVNNNTEIPTPAAEGWSGLPEGYLYRGEAPVVATVYNYGHIVFSPDTDNYYFFTSTISASVARADIPTHANFSPVSHKLTNAEATDDLSTVYGSVTGELIAGAVAAHEDVANSVALDLYAEYGNLSLTVGRTIGANLSTQAVLPL